MTKTSAVAFAIAMALPFALSSVPSIAHAQNPAAQTQSAGILSLSAQASGEVPQDIVQITLFYEQQMKDPGSLTTELNNRASEVLAQAKNNATVTAHTGAFSIEPTTDRDNKITTWRGRTEIVLKSRDFAAASKLAGQLSKTMQIGNVQFSLSPEAQRAAEQRLTSTAIDSFRANAQAAAKTFGYSGYSIREVNLNNSRNAPPYPRFRTMAIADAASGAPLAIEGSQATVIVNVSGSVQMK